MGAAKDPREYYMRGVVSLSTTKCPGVTQGNPRVVWLVLRLHHGDSHTQESRVETWLPRKARLSQEWPWMSWWGRASVGASPRVSRGGEVSDGASPCESRAQSREVLGW